ncbi:MAG TPA: DNA polymerase III subunit beta [Clostridiales bacterium UBA8153]|nr:DNA polymerase III subunit beta [Clostridiales bacterium UBA8153]
MEITINQESLLSAVQVVSRAVATRPTMPVLGGIFVRASVPDRLYLTATDLDAGISLVTTAQVHRPGSVVLPGRMLGEAVRKAPAGAIGLATDPGNFVTTMTWGHRSSLSIHGIEPEQFPSLPEPREEWGIQVKAGELRAMIRQTGFAASQNESRPILTGLLLEVRDGKLWMVGVDFSRMALRTLTLTGQSEGGQQRAVVPAKVMGEVARLLSGDDELVHVVFSSSHAFFTMGSITVLSRLLEGQFPMYAQLIPAEAEVVTTVGIDTTAFLESCDRAALVSDELDRTVKLRFQDDHMTVLAATPDVGMLTEELPVELTGEEMEVAFNTRFMQDALRNVVTERVVLKLTGLESAAIFSMEEREDFTYVLMPLKSPGSA